MFQALQGNHQYNKGATPNFGKINVIVTFGGEGVLGHDTSKLHCQVYSGPLLTATPEERPTAI